MVSALISPASVVRSLVATVILIVLAIVLAYGLGAFGFLRLVNWAVLLAGLAVGLFLILRAKRPLAGAGTIVMAASTWIAFFVMPPAWIWTGLFFLGAILIAWGTAVDTASAKSWPLLLPRVAVGWALVDNAQDHVLNNWLPSVQGTGFFQSATGAASREPRDFLDAAYQGFLKGVVATNLDIWASLTICGELGFGTLLAAGLLTPVAAIGAMWQNGNYMLMKGFTAHGGYTDKTFFAVELFCLITLAGLAYGLDASLRRHVPGSVAQTLMGDRAPEAETVAVREPELRPA